MPNDDLERFEHAARRANKKDEKIAELETELVAEKDKRKEERFFSCLILLCVLDIFSFKEIPPSGIVVIAILELLIILIFARRCGVEEISEWIDWIKSIPSSFISK